MKSILATALAALIAASAQVAAPHRAVSVDKYNRWKTESSNWGRWGTDD